MLFGINFKSFKTLFIQKYAKKLSLELLGLLALFGGAIYLFSHITYEIIWEQETDVDTKILLYMQKHVIHTGLTRFMRGVTWLASAEFLQICYGLLIIAHLLAKRNRRALEIFITGASGLLVNLAMKYSFHRLRPPHPLIDPLPSFSYPSGHATSGFIFYGLLIYLVWKTKLPTRYKITVGSALFSLSLLIGFSRVYLRVHYPSDVASGFCVGFAWLLLLIWLMEHVKKEATKEAGQEVVQQVLEQKEIANPS